MQQNPNARVKSGIGDPMITRTKKSILNLGIQKQTYFNFRK